MGKNRCSGREQLNGLQQIVRDNRQHGVQFKIPTLASEHNGYIVSHHLRCNLNNGFGYNRIDFSGHDGRPGLKRGKQDLPQSASWTGSQPPDVVCYFDHTHRKGFQGAAEKNHGVPGTLSLKMVFRFPKPDSCLIRDKADDGFGKLRMCIQTGTDCCAPQRQFFKVSRCRLNSFDSKIHLPAISRKLLSQRHWNRILEMGPSDFFYLRKLRGFIVECKLKKRK